MTAPAGFRGLDTAIDAKDSPKLLRQVSMGHLKLRSFSANRVRTTYITYHGLRRTAHFVLTRGRKTRISILLTISTTSPQFQYASVRASRAAVALCMTVAARRTGGAAASRWRGHTSNGLQEHACRIGERLVL